MFTGIVQSVATIGTVRDRSGIRTLTMTFQPGFCEGLEIGASVAVDGVCLTVTRCLSATEAEFDVMIKSLEITTLNQCAAGDLVNVERAARDGAEIGGHPLSGHIDFKAPVVGIRHIEENYCIRIGLSEHWKRYLFPKGYIALNGASLTVSEVNKTEGWFEVWLIPETRRMTTFECKVTGDFINVEIERGTQVVVDTVRDTLQESLGALLPLFERVLADQGVDVESLGHQVKAQLEDKPQE